MKHMGQQQYLLTNQKISKFQNLILNNPSSFIFSAEAYKMVKKQILWIVVNMISAKHDDLTIQYGKDKQAHEDVLKRISQKDVPDFIDSADTIPLKDLDDDFAAAEVDSLLSELSSWGCESWNAAGLLCSY